MKKHIVFGSIALGLLLPVSALAHSSEHSNLSATLDARRSNVQATQGIDTAITASTKHDDDDHGSVAGSNRGRHESNESEDMDDDDDAVATPAPATTPATDTTGTTTTGTTGTTTTTTTDTTTVAPVTVRGTVTDPTNTSNRVRFSFRGTLDQIKAFLASIAAALHLA